MASIARAGLSFDDRKIEPLAAPGDGRASAIRWQMNGRGFHLADSARWALSVVLPTDNSIWGISPDDAFLDDIDRRWSPRAEILAASTLGASLAYVRCGWTFANENAPEGKQSPFPAKSTMDIENEAKARKVL